MAQTIHESVLVYNKLRYLKVAVALVGLSVFVYAVHSPLGPANGGTWLGYTLGAISGAIMVWLAWFGIKKRSYGAGRFSAQEWLSAHVYLGAALPIVATLHAGFRFGLNIHTVLYVLMMIVIVSGFVGLYFYVRYPRMLTENRRGLSTEIMMAQIADLDKEIRQLGMGLDDATNTLALSATMDTVVGGNLMHQLKGFDPYCPTTIARMFVERSDFEGLPEQESRRRQLLTRLVRKEDSLKRIRRDVQLRSFLRVWLYIHIPFSIAALMALLIHVVTEFYYW